MRTLIATLVFATGCAGAARYRSTDAIGGGGCLVDHLAPIQQTGHESAADGAGYDDALYVAGQRVPKDDLVLATAPDGRAHELAVRSRRDDRLGVGGLVLGGVLAGTGAGLIGYGEDDSHPAALGAGAGVAALGAAVVVTSIVLVERGGHERERAIAAFNQDAPPSCH